MEYSGESLKKETDNIYFFKIMKTPEEYSKMQKALYNDPGIAPEDVVGNYAWHENFPYETNLLYRYADIRLPVFENAKLARALDIGCGPGRMISRMKGFFVQVDGVDISAQLIRVAQQKHPNSNFYESTGANLGQTPSNSYDFVYSTIALQHIAVNSIRRNIFNEIFRVLKPGGKFTLQFAYLDTLPFIINQRGRLLDNLCIARAKRVAEHADWLDERTDAKSSNGQCDVTLGPKSLPFAVKEFESIFECVEYWFYDIRVCLKNLRGASHCDYWASHWIFFHGSKPNS